MIQSTLGRRTEHLCCFSEKSPVLLLNASSSFHRCLLLIRMIDNDILYIHSCTKLSSLLLLLDLPSFIAEIKWSINNDDYIFLFIQSILNSSIFIWILIYLLDEDDKERQQKAGERC